MARKLIIEDENGQSIYELLDETTIIGRDESCEIAISSDRISRKHLRITVLDENLLAEDLGSSNGTELDGELIRGKVLLDAGSRLDLGGVTIWIDHAPVRASGDSPPATRRQAADRKPRSNSLPLVVGIVAILCAGLYTIMPDEPVRPPSAARSQAEKAKEQSAQDKRSADKRTADRPDNSGLDENEKRRLKERARALSDLDFELDSFLLQDDFHGARDALARFREDHGEPSRGALRKYDGAVKKSFDALMSGYQRQVSAGTPEVGIALIKDRLSGFPEDRPEHKQLAAVLKQRGQPVEESASEVAQKGRSEEKRMTPPVGQPLTQNRAKDAAEKETAEKRFIAENTAGDDFMGRRMYAEAAKSYRRSSEAGLTAEVDHELLRISMRRMRQAERLAAFVSALEGLIRTDPSTFGQVSFLPGRRGHVIGMGEHGIIFQEGSDPVEQPFRVLRADTIRQMITKAAFKENDRIYAATFLFSMNETESAEKLLFRVEKNAPSLKGRIDAALADARSIEIPDEGFTYKDGRYLSPGDLARVHIRETVARCLPKLEDDDAAVRQEAFTELRKLGDRAASSFHRALIEAKTQVLAELGNHEGYKRLQELDRTRKELDKRREHALELIFDTYKYPYPYRGVPKEVAERFYESAKEVKIRVDAVREIWDDDSSIKIDKMLRLAVTKIAEFNLELDRLELGRGAQDPRCIMHLPKTNSVTLRTYAADGDDRIRIDTSEAWIRRNAEVESKATAEEKKQVAVTNEYRLMMGRHAVQMHEKLLDCARMHSMDMAKGGFFAHENPNDPQKHTPNDRARLVGFQGGVSENIATNGGGAIGAHNAWIRSSGHHRNILGSRWRYLGSGQSGRLWTQNFSGTDG